MVVWGFTYLLTKQAVASTPPMLFAFLRYVIASLVLVPIALARGSWRGARRAPWGQLTVLGLVGVGLYYAGFNYALTQTTATQAALVQSSIPAATAVLAILLLGERPGARRLLGIALAVAGVVLVVSADSAAAESAPNPTLGNLIVVGTVLSWALYTVLSKRVAGLDPVFVITAVSVIGALLLLVAAGFEGSLGEIGEIGGATWRRILFLGGVSSAAMYVLYQRALAVLDASEVGAFVNLSPVVGALSGTLVLDEPIARLAVVGGAITLLGVWISTAPARQRA